MNKFKIWEIIHTRSNMSQEIFDEIWLKHESLINEMISQAMLSPFHHSGPPIDTMLIFTHEVEQLE